MEMQNELLLIFVRYCPFHNEIIENAKVMASYRSRFCAGHMLNVLRVSVSVWLYAARTIHERTKNWMAISNSNFICSSNFGIHSCWVVQCIEINSRLFHVLI